MVSYRVMLDVPENLARFVSGLLAAHRREIGRRKGNPSGIPLWVSDVLPGNVHDLTAARENVLGVLRPYSDQMIN